MEYTYKRVVPRSFEETRRAVEEMAAKHGFVVHHVHDLQAALAAKGFPIHPLCIYELALSEPDAHCASSTVLIPCRLHVYVEDGEVCVAAIRPTLATVIFPELEFGGTDRRIEAAVCLLVDSCCA